MMLRLVGWRLAGAVAVALSVALIALLLAEAAPGDPAQTLLESGTAASRQSPQSVETRQAIHHRLGLDRPTFYFSIGPASLSRLSDTFESPQQYKMVRRLLFYTGDNAGTGEWYSQWRRLPEIVRGLSLESFKDTENPEEAEGRKSRVLDRIAEFQQEGSFRSFSDWQHKHRILYDEVRGLDGYKTFDPLVVMEAFDAAYKNVHHRPWLRFVPSFRWHGANNKFHHFVGGLFKGDLGTSLRDNAPVSKHIREKLPYSLLLGLASIFLAYAISIPLGVWAAQKRGTLTENAATGLLLAIYSVPSFFIGLVLLMLLANPAYLNWFPESGVADPTRFDPDWNLWKKLAHRMPYLVLPVATYTLGALAFLSRQMKAAVQEQLVQDYIRTARAKGLPRRMVVWKHAFRNSLLPMITLFGGAVPLLFSGSVIIETLFGIPGLGREIYEAVLANDYPVVTAVFMIFGFLTVAGYTLADIGYYLADPRTRKTS